ncbi:MAG: histidine phosphatase family protein [Planctomycetia bacterium]|nr:histidine phosphatase family protein [Planctomycetia bacterium]
MLQVILIRPGASDFSDQGRIQGTLDVPLNEHGASEVAQLVEQLGSRKIDVLYCSTCEPAQSTAKAIAQALNLKLKKLRDMQNLNHGLWQGMLVDEIKHRQPTVYRQWQEQPESVRPPNGETLAEAAERVDHAVDKLLRRHQDGVIGLVVPEPLASLVKTRLDREELGDLWEATTAHGSWQVVDISSNGVAARGQAASKK